MMINGIPEAEWEIMTRAEREEVIRLQVRLDRLNDSDERVNGIPWRVWMEMTKAEKDAVRERIRNATQTQEEQ